MSGEVATIKSVTITPNPSGLSALMTDSSGVVMVHLLGFGNRVLNNSRGRVNVDTGYLRSTGVIEERPAESLVRVAYRANYARWVHDGNGRYAGNPYLADALREEAART